MTGGDLDELERRIDRLRAEVRAAARARELALARELRGRLRKAERAWDALVSAPPPAPVPGVAGPEEGRPAVPVRERVHRALTLLGVPAAGRLVVSVYEAFFAEPLRSSQLTTLRRDEERTFRRSPHARPHYVCAALTDRLTPARGLLAVSTWPQERRVVGPLSPRVDFLEATVQVATCAGRLDDPSAAARRLLARMARNVPGAVDGFGEPDPERVVGAARAELAVHLDADTRQRAELAQRAAAQLDEAAWLFGAATLSDVVRKGACA
ncbi:hypothetical protein GCM10010404_28240 [Nonomuraea africana]|uniref:ANTAR domain-containing protein n=1 Tax=Nonomuraea africana TaxID=46171 RepID=A0ABR9KEW4_9ACTN|nr:hypothetical protein [Nonomuraea africana]MBE1560542.1 hypothetical protein [Nonomuraea africana]